MSVIIYDNCLCNKSQFLNEVSNKENKLNLINCVQEKGVDISKLALHFTLSNERIPTTLVSTARYDRLIRVM